MRTKRRPSRHSSGPSTGPERPSFEQVYEQHVEYVWWTLRHLGVAELDCDDATHEVYLIVLRRLPEYEPRDRLRGWLGAIAANIAAKFRHREGRRMETIDADPDTQDEEAFDLDGELASADEVRQVLQAVDPELRFVFIQHHLDEVPIDEIAKHLDVPTGTVKTRLRLARKAVKAAWKRYKARELHAEERTNVVSILGPLTWLEAGRQVRPLPNHVRERIWSGIQRARLGGSGGSQGGGDGGGRPAAPHADALRRAAGALRGTVAGRALRAIVAAAVFGGGVAVGALWDPLHRPRDASPDSANSRPELVAMTALVPARAPAGAAPSAAAPTSAPPVAASADAELDVESALMDKASGALASGHPDVALAAVREHAAKFHGGGRRAQQRETLWIAALLRAGRIGEASERLARFEALYPKSPRLREFREALASP